MSDLSSSWLYEQHCARCDTDNPSCKWMTSLLGQRDQTLLCLPMLTEVLSSDSPIVPLITIVNLISYTWCKMLYTCKQESIHIHWVHRISLECSAPPMPLKIAPGVAEPVPDVRHMFKNRVPTTPCSSSKILTVTGFIFWRPVSLWAISG